MDIREIRRRRLAAIVADYGKSVDFARAYGIDPTYLSQILNDHRKVGEKSARNLETKIGLPKGALDGDSKNPITANDLLQQLSREEFLSLAADMALIASSLIRGAQNKSAPSDK